MSAVEEYRRARAHPIKHFGEAAHPERGALDCVLASVADAAIAELETEVARTALHYTALLNEAKKTTYDAIDLAERILEAAK